MIRKLRMMLTEKDENTDMNGNTGCSNPALDLNQFMKEDEMACNCGESKENFMVDCDIKREIKKEIKEEIDGITWEYIRECYFRECFVDMGSRHLVHPSLNELGPGKQACNQKKCSSPNTPPKSNSHSCNSKKKDKKNTSRSSSRCRTKTTTPVRREFFCEDCDFQCQRLSEFVDHTNRKHGKKPHVCKTCGYQFNQLSDLKRHLMAHTGEKPFACNICGLRFSRRGTMGRHMKIHIAHREGGKPFSCKFCYYKAMRKAHITSHIARIHSTKKSACDICGHKISLTYELKRHMKCHSGISEGKAGVMRTRVRRLYQCNACKFETRNRHGICEHLRRHTGEKPYSCSHCDYKAAAMKDVRRHTRGQHHSARTFLKKK